MMKESGSSPAAGIQWVVIQHVLLEKESYIIHNVRWTEELERALVLEGLLPLNGEEKHSVPALLHCVLDHLHLSIDPTKFVKFCQCLAQHGNAVVSENLWNSFRMSENSKQSSARTPVPALATTSSTPVSKENTTVLRGKLTRVQGEAGMLRARVADLEDDQQKMAMFVTKAMDYEDEVTVRLGMLEDTKDLLKSQLSRRDQGLDLWRQKEKEYMIEIQAMQQRMDDMSRLIRSKDSELHQLHRRGDQQQEQIQMLRSQLSMATTDQKKRPSYSDTKSIQKGGGVKKSKPPLKLPTIVKFQGVNNYASGMDTTWESTPRGKFGSDSDEVIIPAHQDTIIVAKSKPLSPIHASPVNGYGDMRAGNGKRPSQILKQSLVVSHKEYICNSSEKWLGEKGGVVEMPNLHVNIPPQALKTEVCVTVTEFQQQGYIREMLDAVGLSEHIEPVLFVELQPHGLHFHKEIYLELKGQQFLSPQKLVVFHKDKDFYKRTKWTDISKECSPRTHKQNIVITLGQFCAIQAFKMNTQQGGGVPKKSGADKLATILTNMLNEETLRCQFHVFFSDFEQRLDVLCLPHKSVNVTNEAFTKDVLNSFFKRGLDYLGHAKSVVSVCHGETLQFQLDSDGPVFHGTVNKDMVEVNGQVFSTNLASSPSPRQYYNDNDSKLVLLTVSRKFLTTEQTVCMVKLVQRVSRMLTRTMTRAVTEMDGFGPAELKILYHSLEKKVVATVDIRQLMEEMKKEDIFRPQEFDDIINERTPHSRAKLFLDTLTRKGPRGLAAFCTVLEGKHQAILDAIKQALITSLSTESMP